MSTLIKKIKHYQEGFRKKVPIETQKLMEQATKELAESDIAKGLQAGAQSPNFTLTDATGKSVTLYEELA